MAQTTKTKTAAPKLDNKSIHPNPRKPGVAARRNLKHAANRRVRADLNREYRGEAGSKKASSYHSELKAIGMGLV